MDKYEYNLKLDQMKSLCAEENYSAAAEIADTINWNKIKNVNALVRAGEIYEKVDRYEDSKDVLLMAYDRSPIGRMIIYRLAEVAIKMGDFTAAQEYFDEFVEIAPHDNLKYVLKYSIKKAQGAGYEELIPILEELKDQEYLEEWAYELAYLYHKAGISDKCIDACDELILWFGNGPYVERALELKMLYQPLTKAQEEKYRQFRQKREGITQIGAEEMEKAGEYAHEEVAIPQVSLSPERFNTVNLQDEIARGMQQILEATEKETVSDTMDNIKKMVEEIPYLKLDKEDEESEDKGEHIETDEEIDGSLKINFQEMIGEESDGQMSLVVPEKQMLERQITGQMSIAEVLEEWERTRHAAEAALQEAEQRKLESAKARALQEAGDIMDRLTDVIPKLDAGLTPKELLEQEYLQASPLEAEAQPVDYADDEIEREITEAELEAEDDTEVNPEEDFDIEDENLEESDENISDMELPDVEMSEDEIQKEIEAFEEEAEKEIEEETNVPEDILKQQEQEAGQIFADMNHMLGKEIERLSTENAFFDKQIAKVTEQQNESVDNEAQTEVSEEQINASEAQADVDEEYTNADGTDSGEQTDSEEHTSVGEADSAEQDDSEEHTNAREADSVQQAANEANIESVTENASSQSKDATKDEQKEEHQETKRMPELAEIEKQKLLRAETRKLPEITLPEEEDEFGEPRRTAITKLSDELKSVFSYFVPVKGMEGQLCQALTGVRLHFETDPTSRSGNLIIQGGHGCGKTVLATSVIKALQKVTGRPNGRIGKIDADALNKKDIQQLLRKVAGGCLIIENAGNISRQAAVTLSLLLEQDTSGVLIILEDTSKGIKKALTTDDGFAKKFTEKINVPIFTNDELVSFARSYSRELGYEIDEMAVLALYNRISNIQRLDQATTLTEVKEIVDGAIDKAERGGIKKAFSILTAKRYTEDDRVILRERDFED